MTTMPRHMLLDSNVWVDYFASNRERKDEAQQLISLAHTREITLLCAAITLKDIYYLIKAHQKRVLHAQGIEVSPSAANAIDEYAWKCIQAIEELATVVPLDQSDVWIATKLRGIHGDFEDDLVLAAAERSRADYLVSNDETVLRHCCVAAMTPKDMVKLLKIYEEEAV